MSRVGDPPVIRGNLRRDLIDLIERHQGGAVSLLDAMLDLLTERADEWVKATGLRVIPGPLMLLAVLRNPGSSPQWIDSEAFEGPVEVEPWERNPGSSE